LIEVILSDLLKYEKSLYKKGITLIAGIDEVGRGPLVGPVIASAVILPKNYKLEGLNDSKKISEKKREEFYNIIMKDAVSVGIGIVHADKIDEINILESAKLAMKIAVDNLKVKPDYLLIDGNKKIDSDINQETIIKGDSKSLSIAAASVIAKVTRDSMMYELDKKYPEYEFKSHKGYPTKKHIKMIVKYGLLDNYRFTFKPINDLIKKGGTCEGKIRNTNSKKL